MTDPDGYRLELGSPWLVGLIPGRSAKLLSPSSAISFLDSGGLQSLSQIGSDETSFPLIVTARRTREATPCPDLIWGQTPPSWTNQAWVVAPRLLYHWPPVGDLRYSGHELPETGDGTQLSMNAVHEPSGPGSVGMAGKG